MDRRIFRRLVSISAVFVICAAHISAQESRVHVGGTLSVVHQTQADEAVGGVTWGAGALFGVQVSPRVAIEFEPLFGGTHSWEYTYRPGPSRTATVVASRRDTFFSFQVRGRAGVLEPVAGVSYVRGHISRHATSAGRPYFDDARSENGVALVGGLDAGIGLAPRVFFVPSFRVLVVRQGSSPDSFSDPLGEQTTTGPLVFRFGAGLRVAF